MFLKYYYYYFLLRNIEMQMMKYCRKIFASHLRQSGNEGEIVDLLQGRLLKTYLQAIISHLAWIIEQKGVTCFG